MAMQKSLVAFGVVMFVVAVILSQSQPAAALKCYKCNGCNDTFVPAKNKDKEHTCDSTEFFCYKYKDLTHYKINRGCAKQNGKCPPLPKEGGKQHSQCSTCNQDLCNSGHQVRGVSFAMGLATIVGFFGVRRFV